MPRPWRARVAAAIALTAAVLLPADGSPADAQAARYVQGIDVSRFQERIIWKRVSQTRVKFAFVQASRGAGDDCSVVPSECGADRYYAGNYRRARANGIRVGAYHRAFAGGATRREALADARSEARVFLREVGRLRRGDLHPALDLETPFTNLNARRLRLWISTWLERVERRLGVKPFIYTNHSSWQATGDTRRFAREGHPLWVAQWEVRSPLVPADNWAGNGWRVWQYTSSGKVRGVRGNVDRNRLADRFRGIVYR